MNSFKDSSWGNVDYVETVKALAPVTNPGNCKLVNPYEICIDNNAVGCIAPLAEYLPIKDFNIESSVSGCDILESPLGHLLRVMDIEENVQGIFKLGVEV